MKKIQLLIPSLFCLSLCIFFYANPSSAGFGKWQLRNPSTQSIHIQDLAYGNGKYVACGGAGLVYSNDLINWQKADIHLMYPPDRMRFLHGIFYALSYGGPNHSSSDGITWHEEEIPTSQNIQDITYGKGVLVAVNDEGIFVAEQGKNWIRVEKSDATNLTGVTFGKGIFIAVGKNGTMLVSQNAMDWVPVNLGMKDDFTAISFGNGTFVAATENLTTTGSVTRVGPSKTLTSIDGYSWTVPKKFDGKMTSILWKNGHYFGSNPFLYSSSDGQTWTSIGKDPTQGIVKIVDGGDKLVGLGCGLYTSNDGEKWKPVLSGIMDDLRAITYGNGLFVAVGRQGVVATSPDGMNWKKQYITDDSSLLSIIEKNGCFVTVGFNGELHISDSGKKWRKAILPKGLRSNGSFCALSKGRDAVVAVGLNGDIVRSVDLKTWTIAKTDIKDLIVEVTYGSGTFVAITNGGTILRSDDEGKTWKAKQFDHDLVFLYVCYGKDSFLLVGKEHGFFVKERVYSSEDGLTWNEIEPLPNYINSLKYIAGEFVATSTGNKILSSPDGHVWAVSDTGTFEGFNAIAYGDNSYIIVGDEGKIMQTEKVR